MAEEYEIVTLAWWSNYSSGRIILVVKNVKPQIKSNYSRPWEKCPDCSLMSSTKCDPPRHSPGCFNYDQLSRFGNIAFVCGQTAEYPWFHFAAFTCTVLNLDCIILKLYTAIIIIKVGYFRLLWYKAEILWLGVAWPLKANLSRLTPHASLAIRSRHCHTSFTY